MVTGTKLKVDKLFGGRSISTFMSTDIGPGPEAGDPTGGGIKPPAPWPSALS